MDLSSLFFFFQTRPTDCSYFDPVMTTVPPTISDFTGSISSGRIIKVEGFDYCAPDDLPLEEEEEQQQQRQGQLNWADCTGQISHVLYVLAQYLHSVCINHMSNHNVLCKEITMNLICAQKNVQVCLNCLSKKNLFTLHCLQLFA